MARSLLLPPQEVRRGMRDMTEERLVLFNL
jgi:hypothetical protein